MESLHQRLSPHAMVRDLVELAVEDTPQYYPYEDKSQNARTFLSWITNERKPQSGGTNI